MPSVRMSSLQMGGSDDGAGTDGLARHSLQPTMADILAGAGDMPDLECVCAAAPADAVAEQLTKAEQRMLPLLQKLDLADGNKLLSIIADPAYRPSDVRWNSTRAVDAFLADVDKTVDAPPPCMPWGRMVPANDMPLHGPGAQGRT